MNEQNRGMLSSRPDFEAIDCALGMADGRSEGIFTAMQDRNLVDEDLHVVAWMKRQPKRERESDNSTGRVQAFRERQRQETPSNAKERQETPRVEKSREEKYPPTPLDEIVELYHAKLPTLPKVMLKTAKRDRAAKSFWRWIFESRKSDGSVRASTADQALTWVASYFDRAAANDFLLGNRPSKGHENWRADFDFLMTERGRTHVIERTVDHA